MKRSAAIVLAVAVVIQIVFEVSIFRSSAPGLAFWIRAVFTIGFLALLLRADRWTWLAPALRILIGLNFGMAVGDRFGLFGHYGSPNVSWGDFSHFVAYTRQVNSFLPAGFALPLAVAATVVEIVLAIALIARIAPRLACLGAALLLLTYTVAMTISFGFTSQLYYAVLELCAGAWFLSTLAGGAAGS
ncbi:MAG TPA: hypothetical protein VGI19_19435 [Candidatus Cybelea sp.]|jgi:uncharacterized membrane protein YphA (DoxX/SURF4 family)